MIPCPHGHSEESVTDRMTAFFSKRNHRLGLPPPPAPGLTNDGAFCFSKMRSLFWPGHQHALHPSQGGSRTHGGLNLGSATQELFDLLGPPLLHL